MPTISQNVIELTVIGLPAHDCQQTMPTNAATTSPAIHVRRVSPEVFFMRSAIAVMVPP